MTCVNFHEASRGRPIFPVLIPTESTGSAAQSYCRSIEINSGPSVRGVGPLGISEILAQAASDAGRLGLPILSGPEWESSAYRPVLGIIEAAEAIFEGHQVAEIAHADADTQAFNATIRAIMSAVQRAQVEHRRTICFVTGVPGAGKTLVGLSLVHDPALRGEGRPAGVFLSGNGPLVRVIREALARNLRRRRKGSRGASREISAFVQNVHDFLTEYVVQQPSQQPTEHVLIFDEAQRAWNSARMERKRRISKSEPEMMLEVMERCSDWSVIVALVGGGQEIHDGEAGLAEWGRALSSRSLPWTVVTSPETLAGGASVAGCKLFEGPSPSHVNVQASDYLHLRVSSRSFRARAVGDWVNAVLECNQGESRRLFSNSIEYPVVLTRDLSDARTWLRHRSAGPDRGGPVGLLASPGALRPRRPGLEVSSGFRNSFPFEEWFPSAA